MLRSSADKTPRREWPLNAFLGLLGLVGLLRIAWLHTVAEGTDGLFRAAPSIDGKLEPLRARLPGRGLLGYSGGAYPGDKRPYYRTAFGLAPWILAPARHDLACTVAEYPDPEQVRRLAGALALVVVAQGDGVALLCPEHER